MPSHKRDLCVSRIHKYIDAEDHKVYSTGKGGRWDIPVGFCYVYYSCWFFLLNSVNYNGWFSAKSGWGQFCEDIIFYKIDACECAYVITIGNVMCFFGSLRTCELYYT